MVRARSGQDSNASEPRVSAFMLQGILLRYGQALGERPAWLSELIDVLATEGGEVARLPVSQAYELLETALRHSGEPALGLRLAASLTTNTHNVVSELVTHAGSLREALTDLLRYGAILADDMGIELHEQGDLAVLKTPLVPSRPTSLLHLCTELEVGGLVIMLRQFERHVTLRQVNFAYAPPAHRAEYDRFFGDTVRFDQPYSGVAFDRALLDAPLRYRDREVQDALRRVAESRLARLEANAPYASRVRALLSQAPAPHRVTMREAATHLGFSQRSLQRRLEDEGVSYRSLSREVAGDRATQLLRENRNTIQEVAFAMGFRSANSFHRAFKRWTGRSPGSSTDDV